MTKTTLTIPKQVQEMIARGALVVVSDSGGKDSQAMRILVTAQVPANQVVVMHASLGDVEWPGALEHAEKGAKLAGAAFEVARATKTFFEMVEHRFAVRPESPSWPSAANRQCTSDLKRGPIEREVRRILKERGLREVVMCTGIRAEESASRAKANPLKVSEKNSVAGRTWVEWLPIFEMTRAEVLAVVADAGEELHEAYAAGNERLSCMFCIMGSRNDLTQAAKANPDLYRRYVEMEAKTGYTMHMSRKPLTELTMIPLTVVR